MADRHWLRWAAHRVRQAAAVAAAIGIVGCADLTSVINPPISECFRNVTVTVYADRNGDEIRQPDEPPIEGVTVGIFRAGDPPQVVDSQKTAPDGTAELGFITTADDCGDSNQIGVMGMPGEYLPPRYAVVDFGDVWRAGQMEIGLLPAQPDSTATPIVPTPESSPIAECFRNATVTVYADLNSDGARQPDEPPIEGVSVGIFRSGSPPTLVYRDETGPDGIALLGFITVDADCGDSYTIGVFAMPDNYAPPQNRLVDFGEVWRAGQVMEIGLLPAAPQQPYTPIVPTP